MRVVLFAFMMMIGCWSASAQQEPSGPILITNVSVFDGISETLMKDAHVVVTGNLITAVSTEPLSVAGGRIIDGGGRTLMPGMIDGHNHIMLPAPPGSLAYNLHWGYVGALVTREAERMLMRGFTTLRDTGGPSYGIAKAIDQGIIPGPRIYPSGHFITQTSGHFDFRQPNDEHPRERPDRSYFEREWAYIADGVPEVRAYAREVLRHGATQLKLSLGGGTSSAYDPLDTVHYSVEEIRAAVDAAEDWGTYVIVHAYNDKSVMRALEAGVKSIDHGNLIENEETILAIKKAGAFLNPQALIFSPTEEQKAEADPAVVAKGAPLRDNLDNFMQMVKKHDIEIAFGVDSFGSPELLANQNLELTRRLKWFTPAEILRQATSNTAKLVALSGPRNPYPEGPLGVIEVGAYADLLLIEGNPLEDLTLLEDPKQNIVLIIKDGVIYKNTLN